MSGNWSLWMIGLMSTLSFFFWWRLSLFFKTKYHVRAEYYFIWVMLSGPCYGFMTWVLFTFLYFSVGLGFQEFFDGLYFLIPNSIAVGGGFGIMIGVPIGFVFAVLNFFTLQKKEKRERQEVQETDHTRKVAELFCIWEIVNGDWGDVGGFLILFFVFLIGVPIFKTKIPILSHLFMFPLLLYLYWTYLYIEYDKQFQPLREVQKIEILSETMYHRSYGYRGEHRQIKIFLVQSNDNPEELEHVIQQNLNISSLRKVTDFSLFRRENDSSKQHENDSPIQMNMTKLDMLSLLNEPKYHQLKVKLRNSTEVLQKTDYLLEFFYYVEPWRDD